MHKTVEPSILYFGIPVVVVSTLNEDESTNIAPMSSTWWLGWNCMLGLDATSKATENLRRTGECVLNLATDYNVDSVDKLALLTGSASIPKHKKALGYRSSAKKFAEADLTRQASELVQPERIKEFSIQLEAKVQHVHDFATNDSRMAILSCAVEITILRVHVEDNLLDKSHQHRIDPYRWHPLIMSFRQFFSLTTVNHTSRLGMNPEEMYARWKICSDSTSYLAAR